MGPNYTAFLQRLAVLIADAAYSIDSAEFRKLFDAVDEENRVDLAWHLGVEFSKRLDVK